MLQKLWIPYRLPGMNELIAWSKVMRGKRFSQYASKKKHFEAKIMKCIHLSKLFPIECGSFCFYWFEKNKRRDPDNIAAGGRKFVLDSLVKCKIIRNDGWGQVLGWQDYFQTDKKRHGVYLEISSLDVVESELRKGSLL